MPGWEADRLRFFNGWPDRLDEPVRLQRIGGKTLFVIATVGLSHRFLVPQLADIDNVWDQARDASRRWALLAIVFSIVTYTAATASLLGANAALTYLRQTDNI